jgi:hypothetical protein
MTNGTRREWGVSVMPRPFFTPGNDPVPIVQEAGWSPGTVWTGAENLAAIGIRSPERPARSQSLYWLSYRAIILRSKELKKKTLSSVNPTRLYQKVLLCIRDYILRSTIIHLHTQLELIVRFHVSVLSADISVTFLQSLTFTEFYFLCLLEVR